MQIAGLAATLLATLTTVMAVDLERRVYDVLAD